MSNDAPSPQAKLDQLIEDEVTRAMAPYRARALPAHVLAEMETTLRLALRTHPTARQLLRGLVNNRKLARSDEVDWRAIEDVLGSAKREPK